jgi:hypothetical protein
VTERSCPGRDREDSGGLSGSESGQGRAGRGTGTVMANRAEPGRLGPCKRACGPGKSSWSEERPARMVTLPRAVSVAVRISEG